MTSTNDRDLVPRLATQPSDRLILARILGAIANTANAYGLPITGISSNTAERTVTVTVPGMLDVNRWSARTHNRPVHTSEQPDLGVTVTSMTMTMYDWTAIVQHVATAEIEAQEEGQAS